jgi:hypothetical protein
VLAKHAGMLFILEVKISIRIDGRGQMENSRRGKDRDSNPERVIQSWSSEDSAANKTERETTLHCLPLDARKALLDQIAEMLKLIISNILASIAPASVPRLR